MVRTRLLPLTGLVLRASARRLISPSIRFFNAIRKPVTIKARAVVNQVRRVLEFVEAEDEILSLGAKAETTGGDTAAETPTSQEHPHE